MPWPLSRFSEFRASAESEEFVPLRCSRRALRARLVAAVVAFVVLLPGTGSAQSIRPAERARLMRAARNHFTAGQYAVAAEEFRSLYEATGETAAVLGRIEALRADGRARDALDEIEKLDQHATPIAAVDRARLEGWRAELLQRFGTLVIEAPEGAVLSVDGRRASAGPFPRTLRVEVGHHAVDVELAGAKSFHDELDVGSTSTVRLTANLPPREGFLLVREQSGTTVLVTVDGAPQGETPGKFAAAPGSHVVAGSGNGVTVAPQVIRVESDGLVEVVLVASALSGTFRLRVSPSNASLAIDGQAVATAPERLTRGRHTLRVSAPGFVTLERDVDVVETTLIDVALERQVASAPASTSAAEGRFGSFFRLSASPLFQIASQPVFDCDLSGTTACSTSAVPIGGGLAFDFGYMFSIPVGAVGFDFRLGLIGLGLQSRSQSVLTTQGQRSAALTLATVGSVATAGPRFTSAGEAVRLSVGLGFGASVRGVFDSSDVGVIHASPVAVADAGILVGRGRGAKLFVGLTAAFDYTAASGTNSGAVNGLPLDFSARSIDVTIGPTIGFQTGH